MLRPLHPSSRWTREIGFSPHPYGFQILAGSGSPKQARLGPEQGAGLWTSHPTPAHRAAARPKPRSPAQLHQRALGSSAMTDMLTEPWPIARSRGWRHAVGPGSSGPRQGTHDQRARRVPRGRAPNDSLRGCRSACVHAPAIQPDRPPGARSTIARRPDLLRRPRARPWMGLPRPLHGT